VVVSVLEFPSHMGSKIDKITRISGELVELMTAKKLQVETKCTPNAQNKHSGVRDEHEMKRSRQMNETQNRNLGG
jgi:hypothetical protein